MSFKGPKQKKIEKLSPKILKFCADLEKNGKC